MARLPPYKYLLIIWQSQRYFSCIDICYILYSYKLGLQDTLFLYFIRNFEFNYNCFVKKCRWLRDRLTLTVIWLTTSNCHTGIRGWKRTKSSQSAQRMATCWLRHRWSQSRGRWASTRRFQEVGIRVSRYRNHLSMTGRSTSRN